MKYLDINLDYEKYFILSVTKLNAFLLSQIIMAVGIALDLTSLQFKKREYLVTTLGVACILTSIHFALLQQQTAALMFLLAAIRHFVSLKWRSKKVGVFFISLAILFSAITYQGYLSLLSCVANVLMASGSFCRQDSKMRMLLMAGSAVWLIHNIILMTPMGILLEVLFLVSGFISFYRYYQVPRRNKN